ncbi:MAG TPA: hypothetical protein VFB59_04540 [Candidatus Saccharimonadales bacterium]|nr:hypothetical protein [Candidatus Saccharimonadales bacterium]
MTLPHYAKGLTFPDLGRQLELSVVKAPATAGIVYTAGQLAKDHMRPELAFAWPSIEDDGHLYFADFNVGRYPDAQRATAALLWMCARDSEVTPQNAKIIIPDFVFHGKGKDENYVRVVLRGLDFNEQRRRGDLGVDAAWLAGRLERRFPTLLGAVAIPNEPGSPELDK